MEELVNDAILFFKMVGESDGLSNKGFDTADIMTVEYGEKIVQEVNNLWELIVLTKFILHGLMMKSIYPNVMSAILIVGIMSIVNTIKKIEYFFSISQ